MKELSYGQKQAEINRLYEYAQKHTKQASGFKRIAAIHDKQANDCMERIKILVAELEAGIDG